MSSVLQTEIPYGAYWCTPFARWQQEFARLHAIEFAAYVAKRELEKRSVDPELFASGVLGLTIPQAQCFWGVPRFGFLIGAHLLTGPTISQACATSARCIAVADSEVRQGAEVVLAVTCDRTSNGPHLYFPDGGGKAGRGTSEDWVHDNFDLDPSAKIPMIRTAENVAQQYGITREEQDEVVLLRYEQYRQAREADFHKKFMTLPFEVPDQRLSKVKQVIDGDTGIYNTTEDGLRALKPIVEGGTVTFGGQTHPADGSAAIIFAHPKRVQEFSKDPNIRIKLVSYGQARVETGFMPLASIKASKNALNAAGLSTSDMAAIKSHNPFVVNDIAFARETGVDVRKMNNNGCSLVWGHPQAPTGMRAVIELIEELVERGGGMGLFHGCAAGDSAMAIILEVSDRGTYQ